MVRRIVCHSVLTVVVILVSCVWANGEDPMERGDMHAFYPDVPRITAYEAKKLYDQGKLILVNAQEAGANKRHMLLGAIAAPDGLINGEEIEVPENMILAFYCV